MFNIGKFLNKKYGNFLNDLKEIEVRSSYYDRCLESTQLIVNGALRSKDLNQFKSVPIHTMPLSKDSVSFV